MDENIQSDNVSVEVLQSELVKLRREIAVLKQQSAPIAKECAIISKPGGEPTESRTDSVSGDDVSVPDVEKRRCYQGMGISEVSLLIPKFNPAEKAILAVVDWVNQVENLKNIYGWDDRATMLYAVLQLEGAARFWYQCKQSTITSWDGFKNEIIKAFPSEKDETSVLFQIMTRKRKKEECVENYFYNVAALANQIKMKEESTVKYIMSGLEDKNMTNVLLAANCRTLTELLVQIKRYEEIESHEKQRKILSLGENDGENSTDTRLKWSRTKFHRNDYRKLPYRDSRTYGDKNRNIQNRPSERTTISDETRNIKRTLVKCFNCGEQGHFANACKVAPKNRVCYACRQPGHQAKDCPSKKMANIEIGASNDTSSYVQDEYHPWISVNNVKLLAYLDLGSECSTVWENVALENNWTKERCETKLIGFGGNQCTALGKVRVTLRIADISMETELLVVPNNAQSTPVIIGRNFLDHPNIKITKEWGKFEITKKTVSNKRSELIHSGQAEFVLKDLSIPISINEVYRNKLLKMLNEYGDCFANNIKEMGKTDLVELRIQMKEDKVVRYQPYKVAYGLKDVLKKKINELLDADIIQVSSSEYASPVLLIPKKNGEIRMCVDYRRLNSVTKRENFPVPNIEDTLNSLANKRYFSSLDLMNGYYQIPIESDSQQLTAFVTPEGHYEFKRMPFGLTNAPAVFMRLMKEITRRVDSTELVSYMDDVLIATESEEKNIEVLKGVLTELRKAKLTLNITKCEFLQEKVNFLGHEISNGIVKPGEAKTAAVREYKKPQSVKEVRQFLGLAGYFRRFVRGFSEIAAPLNHLLKKGTEFTWGEEQELAFNRIRDALSQRPLLTLYDFNAEHELHTDASSHGLAGILMQKDKDGNLRPVSYFSRATTDCEAKYHSYELEALAVVESCDRFKHYLLNKHFKIVTDCNSLRLTQEKKDLVPRIARWWLRISEYDFELIFRPGTKMNHADALSRCPHEDGKESQPVSHNIFIVGMQEEDWLATLQAQDPKLVQIRKILDGSLINSTESDGVKGNYQLENDRIYKKTDKGLRFVVPQGVRWRVIKLAHDDMGHCGHGRTVDYLQKYFWFPNMRQVIKKYINCCIECLYNKKGNDESRYVLHKPERQPIPFYTVHIDHLGPYPKSKKGNTHLIGLICAFTKFVVLKATRSTTSRGVINLMNDVTQYFGVPARLITDRGTAFTSREFERYCNENSIKHISTTVKTPRSNGQIERYFRTVKTALSTLTTEEDGRDWDKHVSAIQWGLNSLQHTTTGKSPQELLLGYHPRTILKNKLILALHDSEAEDETEDDIPIAELRRRILQRINEKQNKQAEKYNSTHKPPRQYESGDLVLLRQEPQSTGQSRKVQPRYRGPYQVKTVLPNDRYVVTDTATTQVSQKPYESVQAADRMKPWCSLEEMSFDEDELECEHDI